MSGPYLQHLAHVRALGAVAVRMLETDPEINVSGAAVAVGVSESLVYKIWRRIHPDRLPRGAGKSESFRTLCDVMLDHVPVRGSAPAGEIFQAVLHDYGAAGERQLYRALRRLLDTQRIERIGPRFMCTYRRSTVTKIDLDDLERKARTLAAAPIAHADTESGSHAEQLAESAWRHAAEDLRTAMTPGVVLALIAHIRELRVALVKAAELTEGTVSTESQHDCAEDDPNWQAAQSWRELVTKGAVLL